MNSCQSLRLSEPDSPLTVTNISRFNVFSLVVKVCDVFLISCFRNAFWLENREPYNSSFLPYYNQEIVTFISNLCYIVSYLHAC